MEKESKTNEKNYGLTQEKLSEIIDVSPSYVSEIERGSSITSLATITKITQTLDLSLDYLIFGVTQNNSDTTFAQILRALPEKNHKLYISLCENIADTLKNS